MGGPSLVKAVAGIAGLAIVSSCVQPVQIGCTESSCGSGIACVAGRCEASSTGQHPALRPAIDSPSVVRLLVAATSIAYLRAGAGTDDGALPSVYALGRSGDDAELLLRFERSYRSLGRVVEAYLVLPRALGARDHAPLSLAAEREDAPSGETTTLAIARIVAPWSPTSAHWSGRPALDAQAHPITVVPSAGAAASPRLVRIDVKPLVDAWRLRDPKDQGIAVIAAKTSAAGVAFASPMSEDAATLPGGGLPFLELYLAP